MSREAISTAFYKLIAKTTGVKTVQRRVKLWSDFNPPDKPTIVIAERADEYKQDDESTPGTIIISFDLIVYTLVSDKNATPATTMNAILDNIDTALRPNELTGLLTLGGLVSHCWIEGKGFKETGDLDGDGVAVIPVKMLIPQ